MPHHIKNKTKKKARPGWLIFFGLSFNLLALSVLMLKLFYPYHRPIAFVAYGISWGFFAWSLVDIALAKWRKNKTLVLNYRWPLLGFFGFLLLFWLVWSLFPLNNFTITRSDKEALSRKMDSEQIYAENYIQKIKSTENLLQEQIRHIALEKASLEEKNKLRELWRDYLGYFIALEEIIEDNRYFYQINYLVDRELNERGFLLAYASFVATYSSALNLTGEVGQIPLIKTFLNEEDVSRGVSRDSYWRLEKEVLRPENLVQASAGYAYLKTIQQANLSKLKGYADDDYQKIVRKIGKNPEISFEAAISYFEKNMFRGWFPVQKKVAELVGDTRISLRNASLIDQSKISQMEPNLLPGDIFLQRRNWYLSNAGLPGFWKHTAIYVGSLSDLNANFPPSSRTEGLVMSEYLKKQFPALYRTMSDNKRRTIEAESEGVISFLLEESMAADYAAVLRPKISQEEKLAALLYAFEQFGKPYDFDFDFLTDSSLVCSEVYYKAYPKMDYQLRLVSGRMVLSSNHIVQEFDQNHEAQAKMLELVYFVDGDEKKRSSFFSDLEHFRQSWKRSETDIMKTLVSAD